MLRLFIAIELAGRKKLEILELQKRAKQRFAGVSWVRAENMHLTLKFLGECAEDKVAPVMEAMEIASKELKPFTLRFGGCGVFPNPQKARVLWTGLKEGEKQVTMLADSLEENMAGSGFERKNRLYRPHLTIGRLRKPLPANMVRKFLEDESSFESSPVDVKEITLFQSKLLPQGAQHTVIDRKSFI